MTMKVWKETLWQIIEDKGLTPRKVSREMGYTETYLTVMYSRSGRGYIDIKKVQSVALCAILGCTEEELTAIPRKAKKAEEVKEEMPIEELYVQITEGFKMLHADLMELIKLWRPEKQVEPKYQVKDREQP